MFGFDKERGSQIVTGIVATLIFIYLLQPIVHHMSFMVVKVVTLIDSAYVDRIYAQAASLQTQNYAFIWLLAVEGFFCVIFFVIGVNCIIGKDCFSSILESAHTSLSTKKRRLLTIIYGLVLVVFPLLFLVVTSANYTQLSTIATFRQQMQAIAPYITDAENKQIYSNWALMRSQKDYETIETKLQAIASQHHLDLPESELYKITTL